MALLNCFVKTEEGIRAWQDRLSRIRKDSGRMSQAECGCLSVKDEGDMWAELGDPPNRPCVLVLHQAQEQCHLFTV